MKEKANKKKRQAAGNAWNSMQAPTLHEATIQALERFNDLVVKPLGGWEAWERFQRDMERYQAIAAAEHESTYTSWFAGQSGRDVQKHMRAVGLVCANEEDDGSFEELCREEFGDIEADFLKAIITAAGHIAVKRLFEEVASKKHVHHRAIDARIPDLWSEYKTKGVSKNDAAGLIAKEVHLAESTVRKKLQKL